MKQLRMSFLFMSLSCLVIFMGISFAPSISSAQEEGPGIIPDRAPQVQPSEIRGTVRINGWTGDVGNAFVHAMPVSFGSSEPSKETRRAAALADKERIAPMMRTADSHVFSFSINGLLPYTPYRLGITVPPNPIRPRERIKTFWSGLPGGMTTSGMPPVAIEGYVANTEIEIRDGNGNWAGADDLQYTNPEAALRTLRWKSNIPGVVAGELQISLNPYPTKGEFGPCDEPEGGVIYRKQFSVRGGDWEEIGNLDFSKILMPGRTLPPTDDEIPPGILPMDALPEGSTPADDITIGDPSDVTPISEMDLKMLALGAPLYVRIVPVKEGGKACDIREDGVHGWVIMAKVAKAVAAITDPPPAPEVSHLEVVNQTYTPPTINKWGDQALKEGGAVYKIIKQHKLPPCKTIDYMKGWPGCNKTTNGLYDWLSYEKNKTTGKWDTVHKYDALGQALIDADSTWASPNQVVPEPFLFDYHVYYSSSCDFWCSAWDFGSGFVTGLYNGVGGFVTWWAEAFESIKDGVASVVADVIQVLPGVGELCKAIENAASCKSIIKAGINYGLASMGLPPSLPNWEQLNEQGMDYLKSELSQQIASATGLPPELANLALDEAKAMELAKGMAQKTIDAMTENRGKAFNGWGANWVLPFDGMEPASRTISVRIKYAEWPYTYELPSNLYLRTSGTGTFTDLWVNDTYPYQFTGNLYMPADVHVPKKFPYTPIIIDNYSPSLKIPIVLQPDYSTIPVPQCIDTMPAYNIKCSEVHLLPDNPFQPNGPSCWQSYGGSSPWKLVDCKNYDTHIAIYYRDYWIENRLDDLKYPSFGCLHLSAFAATKTFSLWLPFDPPFGTVAFTPSEQANTWNGPFYVYPNCN